MEFIDSSTLRDTLNRLGEARKPFLWGISYDMSRGFAVAEPASQSEILWQIGNAGNIDASPGPERAGSTDRDALRVIAPPTRDAYRNMFATISAGLHRGDSFLANLTAPTEVECDLTFREICIRSRAPYRLAIGEEFVCFSPEPFVRIDGRRISTYPMKGTADATLPDARRRLLDDYKELCEHHTIVDLMRNDLNSVATDVKVDRFRYVEEIATVNGRILQTSSEISGLLPEEQCRRFGDILLPLLPAGSISGAPKPATVDLIRRAETAPRGWYTGVFGYFDGLRMQTAVMIRCLQRHPSGRIYFHSGGGITVNSRESEEYDELLAKIYLSL